MWRIRDIELDDGVVSVVDTNITINQLEFVLSMLKIKSVKQINEVHFDRTLISTIFIELKCLSEEGWITEIEQVKHILPLLTLTPILLGSVDSVTPIQ